MSTAAADARMTSADFHKEIKNKLNYFIETGKIPNLIFHGENGSGKRTLVQNFILDIYKQNKEMIKSHVMYVNCAHGKGIKFIRDDLKFFARMNVNVEGNGNFKTIILSNADKLTIDAQSALRRCIELFSHTTRFIIIVNDKYKLLKPILSRLCEIFVPEPIIQNKRTNLYKYHLQNTFKSLIKEKKIDKILDPIFKAHADAVAAHTSTEGADTSAEGADTSAEGAHATAADGAAAGATAPLNYIELLDLSSSLYEKGYSGLDIMKYIEQHKDIDDLRKYQMLITFHKIKKEFRNEKLFMLFVLCFVFLRCNIDLENISFM
jgi:energy-coupling factor transporter ATP-binding protein EcfA2